MPVAVQRSIFVAALSRKRGSKNTLKLILCERLRSLVAQDVVLSERLNAIGGSMEIPAALLHLVRLCTPSSIGRGRANGAR